MVGLSRNNGDFSFCLAVCLRQSDRLKASLGKCVVQPFKWLSLGIMRGVRDNCCGFQRFGVCGQKRMWKDCLLLWKLASGHLLGRNAGVINRGVINVCWKFL